MAVAPAALLLRPLPSLEQQPSAPSVSSASLVSSSSSHVSFFLHHRRPQSFRPAISRITQVEEYPKQEEKASFTPTKRSSKSPPSSQQKKAPNVATKDKRFQNPPPWQKKPSNEALVDDQYANAHSFRPAPWQQGSRKPSSSSSSHDVSYSDVDERGKNGNKPAWRDEAEADKSAMAKIVEKLRTIQQTFDPVDNEQAEEGFRNGQSVGYDSKVRALSRDGAKQRTTHDSQRMGYDRLDRTKTGQRMSPHHGSDHARTGQKAIGRAAAKTPFSRVNPQALSNGNGSTMQADILLPETVNEEDKFPWERDENIGQDGKSKEKKPRGPRVPSLAELTLSREELKRLRILGLQLPELLKIGKLGVSRSIVTSIQQQFTTAELVKVRCENEAAAHIKKTHLEIEEKTGGLVVLRTGKIIVVYRGRGYNAEQSATANVMEGKVENLRAQENGANVQVELPLSHMRAYEASIDEAASYQWSEAAAINEGHVGDFIEDSEVGLAANAASARWTSDLQAKKAANLEAESILEGLGPRFENWVGLLPVPIDADLLPPTIPNYRPPFRLMPYGVKPRMSDADVTELRRRARPLGPHFVLGRNRGHHGLAAAIVKLWEKSEIAKIAVKKRVQNTNNLIMADELKRLTGGILLSRDKFFITFYRGKDFVPEKVASTLVEREELVRDLQEEEEKARDERSIPVKWTSFTKPSMAVVGQEAPAAKPSWVDTMDIKEQIRLKREVARIERMTSAQKMEKKLRIALGKKEKAEQDLRKLEGFLKPVDRPIDVETITEEERFLFRKLGLKMKAYLLIGRRGVFDGVVENMHLHWKHRELVKILVKEYNQTELQETARMLEYESGGVLVAVTATKKGQAIIMYRGKNYERPMELRPRNLLTKRKALKRSLELQRHKSLSENVEALENQILGIRGELKKISKADEEGSQDSMVEGSEHPNQGLKSTKAESNGLFTTEESEHLTGETEETTVTKAVSMETEQDGNDRRDKIKNLERLVRSGPIYRAAPLTNPERLRLRKEALSFANAPPFFVGKNNGLEGLARGIRIYFLHHDLARIVVKGRSPELQMEDLVHDLEELTGGVLVSQDGNKIIMYRGWPRGDKLPSWESLENLTPELLSAIEAEEDWEADDVEDFMSDEFEDSDVQDEEKSSGVQSFLSDGDDGLESEESDGAEEESGESFEWEDRGVKDEDQKAQSVRLDGHLRMNVNAEQEEDNDDRNEEENESWRWFSYDAELDESTEEEEKEEEVLEEEEDRDDDEGFEDDNNKEEEEDDDDEDEEDEDDGDVGWDLEDSDDDAEDSDAEFFQENEDLFLDGINGKPTGEVTESW